MVTRGIPRISGWSSETCGISPRIEIMMTGKDKSKCRSDLPHSQTKIAYDLFVKSAQKKTGNSDGSSNLSWHGFISPKIIFQVPSNNHPADQKWFITAPQSCQDNVQGDRNYLHVRIIFPRFGVNSEKTGIEKPGPSFSTIQPNAITKELITLVSIVVPHDHPLHRSFHRPICFLSGQLLQNRLQFKRWNCKASTPRIVSCMEGKGPYPTKWPPNKSLNFLGFL